MILVVAAIIVDQLPSPTRLLAARRRDPAGRWEFPGGKVEAGEDPVAALHRELAEELRLQVHVGSELAHPEGQTWPISERYAMRVWFVAITAGTAQPGRDHDELRWLTKKSVYDVDWLPADLAVVAAVRPLLAPADV